MSGAISSDGFVDTSDAVTYVENSGQRYLFHYGEGFRFENLPVGTRVIYPPQPLPSLPDLGSAVEEVLSSPLDSPPLTDLLRPGMKITIAFDDLSLPLPPMRSPDVRQVIIEKVVEKIRASGVDDIHLIAALGVHRRMTPSELRHAVGRRVFNDFYPSRLYNHDAEDLTNMVELGKTGDGEVVEVPQRLVESDLLIYVNINLASMDGGHKSIATGLTTYRTLRHHHNASTLFKSRSYMDPPNSALHHSIDRMGTLIEKHLKVFKIETTLNTNTFPVPLRHLQKRETSWGLLDKSVFGVNRRSLQIMPFRLKHTIFHAIRSPYGVTGIAAGATEPVHDHTLLNVFRQQTVPVQGQSDVLLMGLPYLSPYNVNAPLNPILIHVMALGYLFNLYRGMPLVREGGVYIFFHPLERRFHPIHHAAYADFYDKVLPHTQDAEEMGRVYEESFARNPEYIKQYRESYAYHGAHPFHMWYWACYGQRYLGRVIVVGARDLEVAKTLGYETATDLRTALAMAEDTVGPSPKITVCHTPPIFLNDVT